MTETIGVIVQVPKGNYCARFSEEGLRERCPLLQRCGTSNNSYFCPVANYDTHCGRDSLGILKQRDYYDNICPSLYRERIMELLREKSD